MATLNSKGNGTVNFIVWSIIACEIAFWVVIVLGLIARYMLQRKKLGLVLLSLTPVIDLYLLIASGFDMYHGATATLAHAAAAIYIGVSIAYGKSMIQWADERFRYYITKQGEKPVKLYGTEYAMQYLRSFIRHVLAYAIGGGLLHLTHWIVNDESRTEALVQAASVWLIILGIDLLITISYFISPRKEKKT